MPSTFIHAILPTVCIASRSDSKTGLGNKQKVFFWIACAVIANLPDLDVLGTFIVPERAEWVHRNFGHNLFSLIILTLLGRMLIVRFVSREMFSGLRGWLYCAVLVMSHVILDSACAEPNGRPVGIPLLWPFSDWQFYFPVVLFKGHQLNLNYEWVLGNLFSFDYWTLGVFREIGMGIVIYVGFLLLDRVFFTRFIRFRRKLITR
jgi:membrane-bound metal-dependent hydrolase YbcI (DUF457 family)